MNNKKIIIIIHVPIIVKNNPLSNISNKKLPIILSENNISLNFVPIAELKNDIIIIIQIIFILIIIFFILFHLNYLTKVNKKD